MLNTYIQCNYYVLCCQNSTCQSGNVVKHFEVFAGGDRLWEGRKGVRLRLGLVGCTCLRGQLLKPCHVEGWGPSVQLQQLVGVK